MRFLLLLLIELDKFEIRCRMLVLSTTHVSILSRNLSHLVVGCIKLAQTRHVVHLFWFVEGQRLKQGLLPTDNVHKLILKQLRLLLFIFFNDHSIENLLLLSGRSLYQVVLTNRFKACFRRAQSAVNYLVQIITGLTWSLAGLQTFDILRLHAELALAIFAKWIWHLIGMYL